MACSWKLSAAQAEEAVGSALKAIVPVAAAKWGQGGYPIGPEGPDA